MKEIRVDSGEKTTDFNKLSDIEKAVYLTEIFHASESNYSSSKEFIRHFTREDKSVDFSGMAAYLRTRKEQLN